MRLLVDLRGLGGFLEYSLPLAKKIIQKSTWGFLHGFTVSGFNANYYNIHKLKKFIGVRIQIPLRVNYERLIQ